MSKARARITGVLKKYAEGTASGRPYRKPWEVGKAADNKKNSRIEGESRPST